VGGCLVSLLIIKVGFQSGKAACQEIVDRGLEPDVLNLVREGAEMGLLQGQKPAPGGDMGLSDDGGVGPGGGLGSAAGRVSDVRGTKSGAYYIVDVEVEVPGGTTVETFEGIKDEVSAGVMSSVKNVKIVRVFVKSLGSGGK